MHERRNPSRHLKKEEDIKYGFPALRSRLYSFSILLAIPFHFLQIIQSVDDCVSFLLDRYNEPIVDESDLLDIKCVYGDLYVFVR